jgi:hypothetical protein
MQNSLADDEQDHPHNEEQHRYIEGHMVFSKDEPIPRVLFRFPGRLHLSQETCVSWAVYYDTPAPTRIYNVPLTHTMLFGLPRL